MRPDFLPFGRPNFSDREIDAVAAVMRSGWIGMGPETVAFEHELASAVGAPHAVTVNSCTSAIFLSLLIAGVEAGDEVICPSLTWCSSANAALYAGATPVFCDIDADTLCLTPELVLAKVTPRTRAVIVVHFGGLAVDVDGLRRVLPPGVEIVEDAAHAFGGRYPSGATVGSSGNPTCFSFYANKNLSTAEGGAVALFDAGAADRIRRLRQHALPLDAWKRYSHPQALMLSNQLTELGYKMNYTDLQACIGRVQLARQPEFDVVRRSIAEVYVETLSALRPALRFQPGCTEWSHARHLFTVQLPLEDMKMDRTALIVAMRARNIGVSIHYAPLHQMPLYLSPGQACPSLPGTEDVGRRIVTLPISASMTPDEARGVAADLATVLEAVPA